MAVLQGSIEHLTAADLDGRADLWLLSPPCQPYTRGWVQECRCLDLHSAGTPAAILSGKRLDAADPRAAGLLHLLGLVRFVGLCLSIVALLGRGVVFCCVVWTSLRVLERPPSLWFLENVRGFEESQCHAVMNEALAQKVVRKDLTLLRSGRTPVCAGLLPARICGLPLPARSAQHAGTLLCDGMAAWRATESGGAATASAEL